MSVWYNGGLSSASPSQLPLGLLQRVSDLELLVQTIGQAADTVRIQQLEALVASQSTKLAGLEARLQQAETVSSNLASFVSQIQQQLLLQNVAGAAGDMVATIRDLIARMSNAEFYLATYFPDAGGPVKLSMIPERLAAIEATYATQSWCSAMFPTVVQPPTSGTWVLANNGQTSIFYTTVGVSQAIAGGVSGVTTAELNTALGSYLSKADASALYLSASSAEATYLRVGSSDVNQANLVWSNFAITVPVVGGSHLSQAAGISSGEVQTLLSGYVKTNVPGTSIDYSGTTSFPTIKSGSPSYRHVMPVAMDTKSLIKYASGVGKVCYEYFLSAGAAGFRLTQNSLAGSSPYSLLDFEGLHPSAQGWICHTFAGVTSPFTPAYGTSSPFIP